MADMIQYCEICKKDQPLDVVDDYTNEYGLVYKKALCRVCRNKIIRESIVKYNLNLDKITKNFFKDFD